MIRVILWWQRFLLWASYTWYGLTLRGTRKRSISWVVGTDEVASMLAQIASVVPGSYSVSFQRVHYYADAFKYDYFIDAPPGTARHERIRRFVGPILLGRLAREAKGIIYVGGNGFMVGYNDGRDYEMRWAKEHGLKVVCYWTGSDIRSLPRMKELEQELGIPNIATYIELVSPGIGGDANDAYRRRLAATCDKWADAMFNFNVDQRGYLERNPLPVMFNLDPGQLGSLDKHEADSRVIAVHASTSPVIKGTQLVRAAVDRLRREGYDFEYVELFGVTNDEVREHLARAHISLNQFYGFTPTVFGMESMLAGTALLMSSDGAVEPGIPVGYREAWLVTKHFEVYQNLKALLDDPQLRRRFAQAGQAWALENGTAQGNGPRLRAILDDVLDGTYQDPAQYGYTH